MANEGCTKEYNLAADIYTKAINEGGASAWVLLWGFGIRLSWVGPPPHLRPSGLGPAAVLLWGGPGAAALNGGSWL
ncbi:MAG TPA: hypothetical protein PKD90_12625, partial [Phnomibacter sp.]|nr:hypothetical protein [Phnomibacter sp.]